MKQPENVTLKIQNYSEIFIVTNRMFEKYYLIRKPAKTLRSRGFPD